MNTQAFIMQHMNLVQKEARVLASRLPADIQTDDLIQVGLLGLLDAQSNYQKDKGASFETYAKIRVRGAMLDEVRRMDWVSRKTHEHGRKIKAATTHLEQSLGRPAKGTEVAEALGINMDEYHHWLQDMVQAKSYSFGEIADWQEGELRGEDLQEDAGQVQLQQAELLAYLMAWIKRLPEKEQLVLSLHYQEGFAFKDIAKILSLTEARVSQIHSGALTHLQAKCKRSLGNSWELLRVGE